MTFSSNFNSLQFRAGEYKPYVSRIEITWSKLPSLSAISFTTGGENGSLAFSLGIDRLFFFTLKINGIWADSSPFSEWGASLLFGSIILRWHQTTDTEFCLSHPLIFNWKDWLFGECEYERTIVEEEIVSVEDKYPVKIQIEHVVGKRKRWFTNEEDQLMAEMDLGERGIPYIRKGRDDILYSLRVQSSSISEAVLKLHKTLNRSKD